MGALLFNGTTSEVEATSQPGFISAASTFVVCALPYSSGEGSAGTLFSTNSSADVIRRVFRFNSGQLRFLVVRATTNTTFEASDRAPVFGSAGVPGVPAIVAATFDDAASPKMHIYSTSDGTRNDDELLECAYSTTTAGTGAITTDGAGTAKYQVGSITANTQTFDGLILWAAFCEGVVPADLLASLAHGVSPVTVFSGRTNAKVVWLGNGDGTVIDLLDPSGSTWTPANTSESDAIAPHGGIGFAPGAGNHDTFADYRQTISPTSLVRAPAFGSPTVSFGDLTLSPPSIVRTPAFGAPTVTPGAVTLSPPGIVRTPAFGSPTILMDGLLLPPSIVRVPAFGSPTIAGGGITIIQRRQILLVDD